MQTKREQMNVVIVGHVDHGKSTLVGRLLADTASLPQGKLEEVKGNCERNAKPFEYAFLLDALKDERSQGITIDTARCFFKSQKRDYIIIDAPGHIEFLKNMVSGAARAEAALLVIDAQEGIQENSKRHGYMMNFLGIKNVSVCVNKMDLVHYDQATFEKIKRGFSEFLDLFHLTPKNFIPISAREGENIVSLSKNMKWYLGETVLETLDNFIKAPAKHDLDFRFPIQDVYKFTETGDDRRIVAGRIESGSISVGDEVVFFPSQKKSRIKSIEGFNIPQKMKAFAGQSTGFTLETQIYIRPGEIIAKPIEKTPFISTKFQANIFWMNKNPFVKGKIYKLKMTTQHVPVILSEIKSVMDASSLQILTKSHIDRHDVGECILETLKPIAFDQITHIPETSRFVIVDNYEISGGGIIISPVFDQQTVLGDYIKRREFSWERSEITLDKRSKKIDHKSALIVIAGPPDTGKQRIAKALEEELFQQGKFTYFLGISNQLMITGVSEKDKTLGKLQHIQQLGEIAHLMTDAGLILITSITDIDEYDLKMIKSLNHPNKTFVISVGEERFPDDQIDLSLLENEDPHIASKKIFGVLIKNIVLDPEYFL